MERDCNKCVYSTRDGSCRKWNCEGTKTVEDIRAEVIEEFLNKVCSLRIYDNDLSLADLKRVAEQLKENK